MLVDKNVVKKLSNGSSYRWSMSTDRPFSLPSVKYIMYTTLCTEYRQHDCIKYLEHFTSKNIMIKIINCATIIRRQCLCKPMRRLWVISQASLTRLGT